MEQQFVLSLGIGNLVRELDGEVKRAALARRRKRSKKARRVEGKTHGIGLRVSMEPVKVTPMMQQYLQIKERYRDAILFFRLGDFYEMFFEDAADRVQDSRYRA